MMRVMQALTLIAATALYISLLLAVPVAAAVEKRNSSEEYKKLPCYWNLPQSALIRDTIYLNGGIIGGTVPDKDGNPVPYSEDLLTYRRLLYKINLKRRFTQDSIRNISTFIEEAAGNSFQRLSNGHMLANNDRFALYGGVFRDSDGITYPRDDWASGVELYANDQAIQHQDGSQWKEIKLDGVTRYIADGAYVNVPSENLAFVFGGSRGKNWGEIRGGGGEKYAPSVLSSRLMIYDHQKSIWANESIGNVPPRTGGEIVWLPTGQRGALLAFGGSQMSLEATYYDTSILPTEKNLTAWREAGVKFMKEVHIYDVAQRNWYTQGTNGDYPPATSYSCSVVASSKDMSSHQVYVYGGYGGENSTGMLVSDFYDHVYVLSIPSFEWTKVYDGSSGEGRRGHRCHRISDNRMMVVGGIKADVSIGGGACLSGGVLRVFNLNTLKFESQYDPEDKDREYKVPSVISSKIGGNEFGGAGKEVEWDDSSIKNLLKSKYPGNVTNYWPFKAEPDPASNITLVPKPDQTGSGDTGTPSFLPPLLGATLGLIAAITIACGILFWLRRRKQRRRPLASDSGASTILNKHRTWSWLMNTGPDAKEEFYLPDGKRDAKHLIDGSTVTGTPAYETANPVEAPEDAIIYEMPDTGVVGELPIRTAEKRVTISDEVEEITPVQRISNSNQPPQSQNPPVTIAPSPRLSGGADSAMPIAPPTPEK